MKIYFWQIQIFAFLAILIFSTSCNGQVKKEAPKEKAGEPKALSVGQPKLIKTQGSQSGDNVHCSLQDRAGNLWFGGGNRGICRYDGKSYTCFTAKDGLINSDVWSILEDSAGNIWVGTRNTGLYRYDGKSFVDFSE